MPNNLPLAVAIADTASNTPAVGASETDALARDLAARHPESNASIEQVVDALREESIDQLMTSPPWMVQPDRT